MAVVKLYPSIPQKEDIEACREAFNLRSNPSIPTEPVIDMIKLVLENKSRLVTKPTKWHVRPAKTQISLGIRPVWSESSLSAWRKLRSLATHLAHSKDSDQTGRMPRLIWVFAGRTIIVLVLSWGGSQRLWLEQQALQANGWNRYWVKTWQKLRMHRHAYLGTDNSSQLQKRHQRCTYDSWMTFLIAGTMGLKHIYRFHKQANSRGELG